MNMLTVLRKDDILEKIVFFSFGLFPILPNRIKGFPVALLALNALILFFRAKSSEKTIFVKGDILFFLLMTSGYLFYLFSGLYS